LGCSSGLQPLERDQLTGDELMTARIDLTGQRFGRLTVLSQDTSNPKPGAWWDAVCDCGQNKKVSTHSLQSGKTSSCGCLRKELQSQRRQLDLVGVRFGRLVAIERLGLNSRGNYLWRCQCDCGKTVVKGTNSLGCRANSCGCLRRETAASSREVDMEGVRFERLVGIRKAGSNRHGQAIWTFQCDCGNHVDRPAYQVRFGGIKSCGCLHRELASKRAKEREGRSLRQEGFEGYDNDPIYAARDSSVYLVRINDRFLKFGIAFNVQARGRGDYTEVLFERRLPRAPCWAVEQACLKETLNYKTWNVPRSLKCKGFSEFRECLESGYAVDLISRLCDECASAGWREFATSYGVGKLA